MQTYNQQRGFTLLELMIVVLLLVIVTAISLPSFKQQIDQGKAAAAADDVLNALRAARSEAIKRGGFITLCASDDGSSCSNDWTKGYILVVDQAANESAAVQVGGVLLKGGAEKPPASFDFKLRATTTDVSYVRFNNMGTLVRSQRVGIEGSYIPATCQGAVARSISINPAGVANLKKTPCPVNTNSSQSSS